MKLLNNVLNKQLINRYNICTEISGDFTVKLVTGLSETRNTMYTNLNRV